MTNMPSDKNKYFVQGQFKKIENKMVFMIIKYMER